MLDNFEKKLRVITCYLKWIDKRLFIIFCTQKSAESEEFIKKKKKQEKGWKIKSFRSMLRFRGNRVWKFVEYTCTHNEYRSKRVQSGLLTEYRWLLLQTRFSRKRDFKILLYIFDIYFYRIIFCPVTYDPYSIGGVCRCIQRIYERFSLVLFSLPIVLFVPRYFLRHENENNSCFIQFFL